MQLDPTMVGQRGEPVNATIDEKAALAYARATNDDNPAYESGQFAPPLFAVVPGSAPLWALAGTVIPAEAMPTVLHGEQDMVFHRPLRPGMSLTVTPGVHSIAVAPSGARLVFQIACADDSGKSVVDIYNTVVVRGVTGGESAGEAKPSHRFPEDARARTVGEYAVHVDGDQTVRYSEAGADPNPIHLDADLARKVGLPGIIAHGLCTMAMCSQAVVRVVANGDPSRLARLAVRFAKPVFPGHDVVTTVYDAGPIESGHGYAFEAHSNGEVVIKDGWAEIRER